MVFMQTKAEDAAERRMKAQNSKKYYVQKHAEETTKVEQIQTVVNVLEEEFSVCFSVMLVFLPIPDHSGLCIELDCQSRRVLQACF